MEGVDVGKSHSFNHEYSSLFLLFFRQKNFQSLGCTEVGGPVTKGIVPDLRYP